MVLVVLVLVIVVWLMVGLNDCVDVVFDGMCMILFKFCKIIFDLNDIVLVL